MHPSAQKLFDQLEVQRQQTLDSVRPLSPPELNRPLQHGKWSAAQILSHIITAEQLSLLYLQKKINGINEANNSGLIEEVKIILLKISQRLPGLKFKAPKGVKEKMIVHENRDTLSAAWEKVRSELKVVLDGIPDHMINKKIYKHPVAGYLNIKHCLIFFREHIIHHTPQIKKLVNLK